jgi:hypothetical protein
MRSRSSQDCDSGARRLAHAVSRSGGNRKKGSIPIAEVCKTPVSVKRPSVAAAGIAFILGAAALTVGTTSHAGTVTSCGQERWTVKTLQDKPVLHSVQTGTIAQLIAEPKPSPLPSTRAPFELNVFRLTAKVTKIIGEADGDLHLVISDGTHTMIAEAPVFECTVGATAYRRTQMKNARAAVRLCDSAELTGAAFFDFFHHQTGVAPNEIELHPLLAFKCVA